MKIAILFALTIAFTTITIGQSPWKNGKLRVSDNGRYLQHTNGTPFFWLGDTGWLAFQKMDREEIKYYVENRKTKGFNVIQCIFFQSWADVNVYGDKAFADSDLAKPATTPGSDPLDDAQYDFWDHVDYAVEVAAKNGIYVAIVPVWGQHIRRSEVSMETAQKFAANLAERYKNKPNIIWINGGSIQGDVKPEIWNTIGTTIKRIDPDHLMTFHMFGRTQSSTWFNDSPWLDLNTFTSGHRRYDQDDTTKKFGEDNWRYVLQDLAKTPRKPTLDGEASYEDTPQGLHDLKQPYWTAADIRRYAYWSVFAGACGHVYGHNAVRQVHKKADGAGSSGPKQFFKEAMDSPGATQMGHVKKLILSRPFFDRINDQSAVAGDEGEKYDRVLVTKGKAYLFAYVYTGREFKMQMGRISGAIVNAWWYDPRTGEVRRAGTHVNKGTASFDPPGEKANGNDWILVLDDASKKFKAPGLPSSSR